MDDYNSASVMDVDQEKQERITNATSQEHIRHQRSGGTNTQDGSQHDIEHDSAIPGPTVTNVNTHAWRGWAELENDPVIFTAVLRSWGVKEVQVNEVIPLEAILDKDPSSVLGLIFLSRWIAPDDDDDNQESKEPPRELWFANQMSTFSCATLALMNIINNQRDIVLGPELNTFKEKTLRLTPKERGLQLDDFQYVKDVHNSFSRELDRMTVDLRLKDEAQAFARKSRKSRKKFSRRKKQRISDEDEENGFHFVAYVPVQGHLWRLDGIELYPRDMGLIETDGNWLMRIIEDLSKVLDAPDADGTEFSLLSLDRDDGSGHSMYDEAAIGRMREDWSPFIAHMLRIHADKGNLDDMLG